MLVAAGFDHERHLQVHRGDLPERRGEAARGWGGWCGIDPAAAGSSGDQHVDVYRPYGPTRAREDPGKSLSIDRQSSGAESSRDRPFSINWEGAHLAAADRAR